MPSLCIIPARGGSKRIPRKNLKDFCGKPILQYSIETALSSGIFDEVMVSSDDIDILKFGEEHGASVPFVRSPKASSDFATTAEVLLEVSDQYRKRAKSFDEICCLYPTAPFVSSDLLRLAQSTLQDKKCYSVLPIMPFSFPIQRAFRMEGDYVRFAEPEHELTRSQDLEAHFHDAGQFYYLDGRRFNLEKRLIAKDTIGLRISDLDGQDIDNQDDWEIAEVKWQAKQKKMADRKL